MTIKSITQTLSSNMTYGGAPTRNFARHFVEMLVAMVAGMVVFGGLASVIFALLGHANLAHYAALRAVLMASYMTVGMSIWMRYRGHDWFRVSEMAGAMFVPFLVLLVPFWTGLISGGILLIGGHLLMLPAMLAVMLYRREEYSQDHRRHQHAEGASSRRAHTMR